MDGQNSVGVSEAELRTTLLRRWLGIFTVALLATSWPLWTPQHGFPQVPAFRWIGGLPDWWQWLCLSGLILALMGTVTAPRGSGGSRWSLLLFALCLLLSMASDQHRWQPWAYQALLTALVLGTLRPSESWPLLRWLTISIYFYSGLSKCDVTFLDDQGQQFLAKLAGMLHGSLEGWSLETRRAVAGGFALGEILLAAALAWRRTRRVGFWAAVASHVMLLLVLGPLGLGHKPPVLLWNGYFIVQDILLFAQPCQRRWTLGSPWPWSTMFGRRELGSTAETELESAADAGSLALPLPYAGLAVKGLIGLALFAPLLAPWGYCDHWLAWGLYASRAERVRILVPRSQERRLPAELRPYLTELNDESAWLEYRADRWSLAVLGVPLYPQSRFQLAVAVGLGRQCQLGQSLRVVRYTVADRWTGKRERETLTGLPAVENACNRYWLNAQPR